MLMHKKILFGFFFVFLSLFCVSGVHAQQLTTSQCAAQKSTTTGAGGVCKLIVLAGDGCSGTEVRVGDCENGLLSSKYACCVVGGTAATGVNSGSKYIPLEKVPFITGTSFQEYVKGLYVLGLVLVVLSAVFMLVIGGFTYLTSAGNTSAISSAKHIIYGALFGLVLALVSYIILNTINPDLVNVNISTLQPLATRSTPSIGGGGLVSNYSGGGSVTVPPGTKGCYDCVTVTTIPCKSSSSCQLNRSFLAKLEAANAQLKDMTITEAWPPTVVHQSACHSNGTCADIRSNPTDVPNMVRYYKALSSAGLGGSFLEVGKGGSCTPYTTNAVPCIITKGTGYHFHVR